jgi:glucose/arabinose dehydrogenase
MRDRRLLWLLAGGAVAVVLAVALRGQGASQTLPAGAGAIGKGPDALVLKGYEDVPRPPAFTDKTRALAREQEEAIDSYTPQPAWAGQTRAPKPAKIAAYEVQTAAEGLFSPWSFSFLPDGRIIVSEASKGWRIIEKDGRKSEYI